MHTYDVIAGNQRYLSWQYTWWSGMYTIMLTKAAIMHRDYLPDYEKLVPQEMLTQITTHRNCEDIAMAYVVAKQVRTYLTFPWDSSFCISSFFKLAFGQFGPYLMLTFL